MSDHTPVQKLTYAISSATTPHAVAQWRDNLSQVVEASIASEDAPHFHAHLSASAVGHALFMETQSGPQIMERSRSLIRANEFDHLSICVVQSGEHRADQNGTSVALKPGDVLFTHHARPSKGAYSTFKCLRLHLPRSMAPAFLRDRDVNGVVLKGDLASTRLLSRHIEELWASLTELAADEISASVDAAFLIATGNLQANVSLAPHHREAIGRTFKHTIQAFIDERLDDPRLGPDMICASFHISKSKLYRLFEAEGGIASYITACRLDHCWQQLRSGGPHVASIGRLAYAHGFNSDVSFSRAFRRRFGASPREVRDAVAPVRYGGAGDEAALSTEARIMGWYRDLATRRRSSA
ncbi:MAG: helix-turn-helix domain-containing protein [Pseudomonadota bacterium]